jgi:4-amino-4-deoxychorismate lyase
VLGATATWLDGAPVSSLPLPDRGLDFGDGLFETILLHQGRPLLLDLHLQRLQRGLEALHFPSCLPAIEQRLREAGAAVAELGWGWVALRATVTRGAGPRGYAPPAAPQPRILLRATALENDPLQMSAPVSLALATIRCGTQPALAGLKHLNRLEQVLAAAEAAAKGMDDALLLNQAGDLVSVSSGNIFLLSDGVLLTPPLDSCGIAGTRRRFIVQRLAPACGLEVRETRLTPPQLEQCDEAFYSNSLVGLRPIGRFGDYSWQSHGVCQSLFEQYRRELA